MYHLRSPRTFSRPVTAQDVQLNNNYPIAEYPEHDLFKDTKKM